MDKCEPVEGLGSKVSRFKTIMVKMPKISLPNFAEQGTDLFLKIKHNLC